MTMMVLYQRHFAASNNIIDNPPPPTMTSIHPSPLPAKVRGTPTRKHHSRPTPHPSRLLRDRAICNKRAVSPPTVRLPTLTLQPLAGTAANLPLRPFWFVHHARFGAIPSNAMLRTRKIHSFERWDKAGRMPPAANQRRRPAGE
ncbi:hypothetical protein CC80DRAFT_36028 [Byssothecium circinans]|uniref:Uncharacterized protein n=1 Tax=Byssothecium circinans TaxID=147558 RepID=A0A6A5TZ26_9PLEO|nr:hypothetical protein CC80DRAFT_36028 [Byssothecium circinans]